MKLFYFLLPFILISCSSRSSHSAESAAPVVKLPSVKIGEHYWTSKNVSVAVFANGDSIPEAKTPEEWQKLGKEGKPAWCHYENNAAGDSVFGKLYNWFAVNDPRSLAPEGWHVATREEWAELVSRASMGAKFKSRSGWDSNGNGTNESGLNVFPAGERHVDGVFSAAGALTTFWTSTSETGQYAWNAVFFNFDHRIRMDFVSKAGGASLRLVRD